MHKRVEQAIEWWMKLRGKDEGMRMVDALNITSNISPL